MAFDTSMSDAHLDLYGKFSSCAKHLAQFRTDGDNGIFSSDEGTGFEFIESETHIGMLVTVSWSTLVAGVTDKTIAFEVGNGTEAKFLSELVDRFEKAIGTNVTTNSDFDGYHDVFGCNHLLAFGEFYLTVARQSSNPAEDYFIDEAAATAFERKFKRGDVMTLKKLMAPKKPETDEYVAAYAAQVAPS